MVIISNGFNKFFLSPVAADLYERNLLTCLITGAYPTAFFHKCISFGGCEQLWKIPRLIARAEKIPDSFIHALWLPEFMYQMRQYFYFEFLEQELNVLSFQWYGRQASYIIEKKYRNAKIYHYRAGFGHESVYTAKKYGMITICDHSIAHPIVLDYLVNNNGVLPSCKVDSNLTKIWKDILLDIEQADYVFVNCDFIKETFDNQRWGRSNIYVIQRGVDQQFLDMIPLNTIEKYNLRSPIRLLFSGFLGRRKGAIQLIDALSRIDDQPWSLEITGHIAPEIRRQYTSFFRDHRVKYLGLLPSRRELAELMTQVDVFVFPTLAEGSARVVFEALACGLFVITTPNCGSIVEDGVHGSIVPPGDIDALEKAIRKAITTRDQLHEIGRANSKVVREQYTQKQCGDKLIKLYNGLLEKKRNNTL